MTSKVIRSASAADAAALLAIYRPYVETTPVSFETSVPTTEEFAERISTSLGRWSWLVVEVDDEIVGYAYGCSHRARQGYRWSVETSAYVREDHHRQGVAKSLYVELLKDLAGKGFCNAYAGITLPNDASVGLHMGVGFAAIGVFPAVGRKFGSWHDVAWFHRGLQSQPPED